MLVIDFYITKTIFIGWLDIDYTENIYKAYAKYRVFQKNMIKWYLGDMNTWAVLVLMYK